MTCDICDYDKPLTLIDHDVVFVLCPNHLFKLVTHDLSPEEAKKLIKKHGNKTFYLHNDFYDDQGNALQRIL